MRRAAVALALVGVISGCAGPLPAPTGTPEATSAGSAEPSAPAHAALRGSAAEALGVEPEQLVLLEDGFVVARFPDEDGAELELVWIGLVDGALTDRVLATVPEQRADSMSSLNAAVCPDDLGLARTRFLFGQQSDARRLLLTGPEALGGEVSEGTYVFALADGTYDGSSSWAVTHVGGDLFASGVGSWLESPPVPPADAACTLTSAEH